MWQVKSSMGWNENIFAGGSPGIRLRTTDLESQLLNIIWLVLAHNYKTISSLIWPECGKPNLGHRAIILCSFL